MRRRVLITLLVLLLPLAVSAAEELGGPAEEFSETHGESHDNTTLWKAVNFAILAGFLGWLISKFAGPYFRSRTENIGKEISESASIREEALAKAAEMSRRMDHLESEIQDLRRTAREEMDAEHQRLQAETERLISRVQANAEKEIEQATKNARKELRTYSAQLALDLARQRIRDRMSPSLAESLMDSFVQDLGRSTRRIQ